jgi:hypothetical protein
MIVFLSQSVCVGETRKENHDLYPTKSHLFVILIPLPYLHAA